MHSANIYTFVDLDKAVTSCQEDFDRIAENRCAVKKLETGLKYIDTVTRLKLVAEKSPALS